MFFCPVLDERPEHRVADLPVARLVGLDARQGLLEEMVGSAVGHGRHSHKLKVREPGLEHEVELNGKVHRVCGQEHVVE